MSDIKVNIVGEFDKKGFDAADKATNKLGKSFDKLAKRLGAALTIGAIAKFSKAAVTAFAEDDKAAKQLTRTYQNLGLAFEGAIVNDYIDQLQRATGVADTELRPALSTLTQATLDYGKAQQLLGVAMDISAATGNDLQTVSKALAKAQLGQLTALAKLNVGITTAEAKTLTFDQAIEKLSGRFKGSAKGAAESYEGQINRLKVAADEAQESLGKKLVTAINILSNGKNLDSISSVFQKMADNAGNMAIGIAKVVAELNKVPGATQAGGWIDKFNSFMDRLNLFSYLRDKGAAAATSMTGGTRLGAPGALAAAKENARILAENRKEQARILALQKAQAAEQAKQKRLRQISAMLAAKEAKFDLQRIQLAAAAQGKLTEDEKKRIAELQTIEDLKAALAADDLATAEKLLNRLEILQSKTENLAYDLASLKAGDPFSNWGDYFASANKLINDLFLNFRNQAALLGTITASLTASRTAANTAVLIAKTEKADAYSTAADAAAAAAALAAAEAEAARLAALAALAAATSEAERLAAEEALRAALEAAAAAAVLDESVSAAYLAAALADDALANEYLNQSIEAITSTGNIPSVSVTVNVAGNLTSENDLVQTITDNIYRIQKTGKQILLSSVSI